ncbi:MAG: sigma-54 dependent transcriptional regulator [Desulfobulbaceae bacterium]|nr:sigma-54 dependent transcriptional regulator [Desulfobulbaceae bacterium]
MQDKRRLLIIDDEENMRKMLTSLLSRHGYEIQTAADGLAGISHLKQGGFDFVLCDVKMPKMDGLEFLVKAKTLPVSSIIIMMSAYGNVDSALEAIKFGAYDYISKPFKIDEILLILNKAEEREKLRLENQALRSKLAATVERQDFAGMIGKSRKMRAAFNLAEKVSRHKTTVLITGESGTGKELMARAIHDRSERTSKPFVAVNCGGVPESLLESEFFGYVKGAFTGADANKKGLFAEAEGGTIFLDEIGELPLSLQVKLLRVLQENEIRAVGSNKTQKVNVRVVAATARDLENEVRKGTFRKDLFFRLNVMRLHIPPLRERIEDLRPLCDYFIKRLNERLGRSVSAISIPASNILMRHDWQGNVRELQNVLERAIILAEKDIILPENLPPNLGGTQKNRRIDDFFNTYSLKKAKRILEEKLISRAMEATGGNKSKAAGLLEISYPSLLNKLKEFGEQEDEVMGCEVTDSQLS